MTPYPLVSATGMLGSGYREESLDKAIELGARMIGCDAGSTDPGRVVIPGRVGKVCTVQSVACSARDGGCTTVTAGTTLNLTDPLIYLGNS